MTADRWSVVGAHDAVRYLGESERAGAAYACDRCGAHWYSEIGERPPARCIAEPEWLRRHPGEQRERSPMGR